MYSYWFSNIDSELKHFKTLCGTNNLYLPERLGPDLSLFKKLILENS